MSGPGERFEFGAALPDSAAGWLARWRSHALSPGEQRAFDAWLEQDANRADFAQLSRLWSDMEAVRAHPAVLSMREQALAGAAATSRARWTRAVAAVVVACGIALGAVAFHYRTASIPVASQDNAMDYETRVGQKSTITLPDGSLVVLDTDSSIRAWSTPTERRVSLTRGRAFFDVAKDAARPFSVTAASNTVVALGTSFDVGLTAAAMEVTLVTGQLRVHGQATAATAEHVVEMHAGQRLIATNDQPWTLREADSRVDTGWLRGQLVFDEAPLGEIAAALNRYSTKKIVIDDPHVASKHLSAVLVAGDIDTFIQATDTLGLARVGANDARHVELVEP
jgi:transmembrane sensor